MCTIFPVVDIHHFGIAPPSIYMFQSVKECIAWNTTSSFGFQSIQCEPVHSYYVATSTRQGQLTLLVSAELNNFGSEMICACAHPGTKNKDFTIQSSLHSSFKQAQCGIARTLSFVRKTTNCRPWLRHKFQFLLPTDNPREVHFCNHVHISELASYFFLEKSWGASDLVCQSQEQWNLSEYHVLEQAIACIFLGLTNRSAQCKPCTC
ncbi:hypothetical protein ZWY2020_035678 [Hordeum vulgare]|nr:hypothetical protein ZWY2020_035678 [Hordeum vulgare]